ncbi:LysE family translocator [Nakamurella flava]|uniref:LysE family translocator n=1 Tax=Nakamurella flava TaxID=2576308 RepID=A0A4U6Q8W5_9ACTN|nr:LysE family translocator [Nakamurella flava]TKV56314.1 LysE family translocator [Nakamurella flava]
MNTAALLGFAGLCLLLALTPGPDVLLVIRHSTRRRRGGIAVAVGSAAGSIVWAALVAGGLAALLEQSAEAFRLLRIVGGCYLLYLGVRSLLAARHTSAAPVDDPSADAAPARPGRSLVGPFLAGFGSCLLNPKVGLFFLAVVPQFLPDGGSVVQAALVLGVIDALVALAYLAVIAALTTRIVGRLHRPHVQRRIEAGSGGLLALLGAGTVVQAATART